MTLSRADAGPTASPVNGRLVLNVTVVSSNLLMDTSGVLNLSSTSSALPTGTGRRGRVQLGSLPPLSSWLAPYFTGMPSAPYSHHNASGPGSFVKLLLTSFNFALVVLTRSIFSVP
jgi:hypothetical protein